MKENNWRMLWDFVISRIKKPWKDPSFIIYFFVIIFFVGMLSVIYEIALGIKHSCFDFKSILLNMSNIAITLIAASSVELMLRDKNEIGENYRMKDIQVFILALMILGFVLWNTTIFFIDNIRIISWFSSIISLFIGFLIWWISNSDNLRILGSSPSLESMGGDEQELNSKPTDLITQ